MITNYWTKEPPEILFNQKYCDVCEGGGMVMECYGGMPSEVSCSKCDGEGVIPLPYPELCLEILKVFNDFTGKFEAASNLKLYRTLADNLGVQSLGFCWGIPDPDQYVMFVVHKHQKVLLRYHQNTRTVEINIPLELTDRAENLEPYALSFMGFFRYKP